VLGVTDSEQLFAALDAVIARDPAGALRAAAALSDSGRDPGQVLRDLEVHGRELLAVQVIGEVPAELRVTPERDARLEHQASSMHRTDAVRLLDLVSQALDATANGANARIQLELLLVKAAAPELDPSTAALQARVERLEAGAPAQRAVEGAPSAAHSGSRAADDAPSGARTAEPATPAASATEQAEPAASVVAEASAPGALDLDSASQSWPAVVDLVRTSNPMLAGALEACRPVAVADRELTLAFPAGASFLKRKAEQDEHRRVAIEAVKSVTGQRLALVFELRELPAEEAEGGAEVLSGDELVRRFMEEFDAEEIFDEESDADPNGKKAQA
jgi:DNA polymerase-3 subunit gamma/tau